MAINNDNLQQQAETQSESAQTKATQPVESAESLDEPRSDSLEEQSQSGAKETATRVLNAVWSYIKSARVELIVLVSLLALDLITKAIVAHTMHLGDSIRLIPDFLYLSYVRNTKAAFGSAFGLEKVLSDGAIRIIFLIVTLLAVGMFFYLMVRCRRRHILMRLAFAMVIAGALGNFYDRLVLHYVRDFIEFVFFGCDVPLLGTSFPVFNVADAALTVGVVLFLIYFIVFFKDPQPAQSAAAQPQETVEATVEEPIEEPNEEPNEVPNEKPNEKPDEVPDEKNDEKTERDE